MQLGEQIKTLREEKNMSQEDLAKEMNVSRQAVYKWERNKGYPDIENLIRLSEIFDVTIDALIKGDRQFRKKISVDEDEKIFQDFSDPGFYLGMILVFIGLFTDFSFSAGLTIIGFLTFVFYDDFRKVVKRVVKDFKEE